MKTNWPAYRLTSLFLLVSLALFASPTNAVPGPSPKTVRVDAHVNAQSVRIESTATGAFEYTSYRPSANLLVVDLAGVVCAEPSVARVLKSDLVSSYRTLQHGSGEHAVVRLEVLLRAPAEPRIERRSPEQLTLIFEGKASPDAARKGDASPVGTPSSSAPARVISHVEVGQAGQAVRVRVRGDGRLAYQATRMTSPARVVLDFTGARLALAQKTVPGSMAPIRGVRLGQFRPDVSRVVIDLERMVPYDVHADGQSVTVTFAAPTAVPALQSRKAETAVKTASEAGPAPQAESVEPASTATPVVASPRMSLPESLTQPSAALAIPAAAPQAVASATPVAPASAPPQQPAAQQPAATAPAAQVARKYSGEPISVNLKEVDLKDFFRLIHEISGLNVVLDPSVKGSLTIVLDEIPWDQALDIVLQNNNLDKQLEGNVLRVATRDALKREAEARRDLAKAEADAVPQVTATRVLSYTKASALRDTVKKFLSTRGDVLADERSNTLIIRDIPAVLPQVDNLLRQLDRKGQQVEIEARVVAASRSFARDIGTQFGFTTTATNRQNVFGGLVGRNDFISPVIQPGPPAPPPPLVVGNSRQIPLNTNLGAVAPTSGFTFSHLSTDLVVDYIISVAESKGVGKLLSKPKVITQNNEKATVKQGTKVPIQTTINNTISVQFIDAVLKLEVTPQITADGTIFMEVLVENTQIDAGIPRVQGIPALNTQSTETKVLINDGGTVVIGGVIISTQRTDISQVPLFGSVPLIGHLFKRTSVNVQSQELLFFLTPRILPS